MGANLPSATPCSHYHIALSIGLGFFCWMAFSCISSLFSLPRSHGKLCQCKDKYSKIAFCSNADSGHLSDCNPTCLIPLRIQIFSFQALFHRSASPDISISVCSQGLGCLRLEALVGEGGTSHSCRPGKGFQALDAVSRGGETWAWQPPKAAEAAVPEQKPQ